MSQLTLAEVIERINRLNPVGTDKRPMGNRGRRPPEFYRSRLMRRVANFMFGSRGTVAASINAVIHPPSDGRGGRSNNDLQEWLAP